MGSEGFGLGRRGWSWVRRGLSQGRSEELGSRCRIGEVEGVGVRGITVSLESWDQGSWGRGGVGIEGELGSGGWGS